MRRKLLVVALAAWLGLPAPAAAQQLIRLGHVGAPGSLLDIVAGEYARRVNEALKGKVEVRVFPASQLGTDEQMIKGIKQGAPEMFVPSTVLSTVDPRLGVFEMPYLIAGRAHMKKVAESAELRRALLDGLPNHGLRALAVWENGVRHLTNNVRAIIRPADLKGLKLRVPSGPWRERTFKAFGANPTALAFAELHAALQSGAVDGQESPLSHILAAKLHEVQKHLALSAHVYTPSYLVVSETFWQKLPEDQRQVLQRVALEVADVARTTGERLDRELLEKITAGGTIKVSDVDADAFTRSSAPIHAEFAREVPGGGALIKLIQSLR